MQLTVTTDYAVRTLLCLNRPGNRLTAEQIAQRMAIPDRYLQKVLKKLKQAGLICSYPGIAGGYELSRELDDIAFWDVLVSMEETMQINPCLQQEENCSRRATQTCPVRKFYCGLQTAMETKLKKVSVGEIQQMKSG